MSEELKAEDKMTEKISEEKIIEEKMASVFSVCAFVETEDGRIEATCETKEAAHKLADLLEKEVTIRVKAKVTQDA